METRLWIGQSRPRNPERGDITGGSQFYFHYRPGFRDAISRELLAHGMVALNAECLVAWERRIYQIARDRGAVLPALVDADRTTVTTELVGPSVRMLLERHDLPIALTEEEAAALVTNTLRAGIALADAGLMPFDGHLHNYWVWLENGVIGGHLDFARILPGDHSFTLARDHTFGRPLWCSAEVTHFPPEAKVFKRADEAAFAEELRRQGFAGETLSNVLKVLANAPEREQRMLRWRLEQAYEQHQAPQQLEAALDTGAIEPHRMMQFSVGAHLLALTKLPGLPAATARMLSRCATAISRMADVRPEARFESLAEAADAVAMCWSKPLPQRSIAAWPEITPSWLIWDVRGGTDPEPSTSKAQGSAGANPAATSEFDADFATGDRILPDAKPTKLDPGQRAPMQRVADVLRRLFRRVAARPAIAAVSVALTMAVLAGIRVPQTPEAAALERRHTQIGRLVRQAVEIDRKKSSETVGYLQSVIRDARNPDQEYAKMLIQRAFSEFEQRHLGQPLFSIGSAVNYRNARNDANLVSCLEVFASLDHERAKQWLQVIKETAVRSLARS